MKIITNKLFEIKINRAVFINQSLVVFPQGRTPDNLIEVIKFLFGEGSVVTQDCVNNHVCFRITNASYVLDNVKTIDAKWEFKEVKDEYLGEKVERAFEE